MYYEDSRDYLLGFEIENFDFFFSVFANLPYAAKLMKSKGFVSLPLAGFYDLTVVVKIFEVLNFNCSPFLG